MTRHGYPGLTLQSDWTINEDENGLLSGELTWIGDFAYRFSLPWNGSLHPYDARLTAYARNITRIRADRVRGTLKYIGVTSDPTPKFIEHPGGSGQDPIQTHPDFAGFAGTPETPLNGAVFDEDTEEFIGFTDPGNDLAGVESYIVPSVMVNLTYYTHYVPELRQVGRRYYGWIPDLNKPPNVRNWLLVGSPYRKVGNLFQVTEQLLGSGPNGWNRKIYG